MPTEQRRVAALSDQGAEGEKKEHRFRFCLAIPEFSGIVELIMEGILFSYHRNI